MQSVQSVHNVEKCKTYSDRKNILSNQLFSDFFDKNVDFTENLPRKCEKLREFS